MTGKAPEPRVMLYALGGGNGHAVRGSALTAALERQGAPARVLVPKERAAVAEALGAPAHLMERPTDGAALARAVDEAIDTHRAQLLVVDTFPEGLLDELDGLGSTIPRLALLRCRKDADGDRLRRGLARCAHALDLEPHLDWRPPSLRAEPFGPVVRPLSVSPPAVDVAVLGTDPAVRGFAERLAHRLIARGLRVAWTTPLGLHGLGSTRPASPLPPEVLGAPVVVGPAGFNLSYEVRRLGGWHLALPRPRPFDDQHRRARALAEHVHSPEAAERKVVQLLRTPPSPTREPAIHDADDLAIHLLGWWRGWWHSRNDRK